MRLGLVLLLVGVTVVVGSCTTSSSPEPDPPSVVGLDPVIRHPDADFGTIDRRTGERVVTGIDAGQVEIGFDLTDGDHPGPALLQFAALDLEADCVVRATLDIVLEPAATADVVAAYPVRPEAWPEHAADQARISRQLLLDNRPRGVFSRVGSHLTADVTELVRTWQRGGPFPSRGATVAAGTPLRLTIQPGSGASPTLHRLAMSEVPDAAPTLRVQPCAPGGSG